MKTDLSQIRFRCVDCGQSLSLASEGALCQKCSRRYIFENGVWDLLPSRLETVKINENLANQNPEEKVWRRLVNKHGRLHTFEDEWLPRIISPNTKSFLEIGGGLGYSAAIVKEHRPDITVVASDISAFYLRKQSVKVSRIMEVDVDLYAAADGENLPFENDQIDAAFSQMVLYRVPDPVRMLREIHRVLAPGGRYLGVERASPRWTFIMKRQEAWLNERAKRLGIGERPVQLKEWRKLAGAAGLPQITVSFVPGRKFKSQGSRHLFNAIRTEHVVIEIKK